MPVINLLLLRELRAAKTLREALPILTKCSRLGAIADRIGTAARWTALVVAAWYLPSLFLYRMGDNGSLYFYSATLQAFAALLAISATFLVFRINQYNVEAGRIEATLSATLDAALRAPLIASGEQRQSVGDPYRYTASEVLEEIQKQARYIEGDLLRGQISLEAGRLSGVAETLNRGIIRYYLMVGCKGTLRDAYRRPAVLMTAIMLVSLFLLPLSEWLHRSDTLIETQLITGVALLGSWALLSVTGFIRVSTLPESSESELERVPPYASAIGGELTRLSAEQAPRA